MSIGFGTKGVFGNPGDDGPRGVAGVNQWGRGEDSVDHPFTWLAELLHRDAGVDHRHLNSIKMVCMILRKEGCFSTWNPPGLLRAGKKEDDVGLFPPFPAPGRKWDPKASPFNHQHGEKREVYLAYSFEQILKVYSGLQGMTSYPGSSSSLSVRREGK